MSVFEIITLTITVVAWLATFIVQLFLLGRQHSFQVKVTEIQNKLTARREIASTKLRHLESMEVWLEEGLKIWEAVLPIDIYIHEEREYPIEDPKPDIKNIYHQLFAWSSSLEKFKALAQIYDTKTNYEKPNWVHKENAFPEDLPRLLGYFERVVSSFVDRQIIDYENLSQEFPPFPDEREEGIIPDAGKLIIPVYQKSCIAIDRVKEYVTTEPLPSK